MRECKCGGFTTVYSTRRRDDGSLVRYLRCSQCGETSKQTIPDEFTRRYKDDYPDAVSSKRGGTISAST